MLGRPSLALTFPGLLLIAAFAGCLETEKPLSHAEEAPHAHGMMSKEFLMGAENCEEGGFVAVYPMAEGANYFDTWFLADIREEVGNPLRNGFGAPLTGPADGNWHMGFRCESVTWNGVTEKNYIFGYVANMVEPPAFDPGGADLHFIVSGIGFGNGSIAEGLRETTTADISHAYMPTQVTWYAGSTESPRSFVHAIYSDAEKGQYVSYSWMSKYRDFPERTIRLWWQVPEDGSDSHMAHAHDGEGMPEEGTKWHPVFWDIHTTGGEQFTTPPGDSPEVACHFAGGAHGPQGGACQPTLTNIYEHKSLTFTAGHVIDDVVLTDIWSH